MKILKWKKYLLYDNISKRKRKAYSAKTVFGTFYILCNKGYISIYHNKDKLCVRDTSVYCGQHIRDSKRFCNMHYHYFFLNKS